MPTPVGRTAIGMHPWVLQLHRRRRTARDSQPGAGHALEDAPCSLLRRAMVRDGDAARAGACRSANAVHVVLRPSLQLREPSNLAGSSLGDSEQRLTGAQARDGAWLDGRWRDETRLFESA